MDKGSATEEFLGSLAPERSSRRRNAVSDREPAEREVEAAPPAKRTDGDSESAARRVLAEISRLYGEPKRYQLLEKKLWEHIDALVPNVMSMADWNKTLRELREANMNADRQSGATTEDPLNEIRKFLGDSQ